MHKVKLQLQWKNFKLDTLDSRNSSATFDNKSSKVRTTTVATETPTTKAAATKTAAATAITITAATTVTTKRTSSYVPEGHGKGNGDVLA